jgi:tRNA threonylcarbamoyladenosine biosynthesis protein TsaE
MQYQIGTIETAIAAILPKVQASAVLAFHGEMGAGKTTLCAALGKALQVQEAISSPTYGFINEYLGFKDGQELPIAHFDWYRVDGGEALIDIGVLDYFDRSEFCCWIEWSERAPELLPENTVHIYIDIVDEVTRNLRME